MRVSEIKANNNVGTIPTERVIMRLRETALVSSDRKKGRIAGERWACDTANLEELQTLYDKNDLEYLFANLPQASKGADFAYRLVEVIDQERPSWRGVERFWKLAAGIDANTITKAFVGGFIGGATGVYAKIQSRVIAGIDEG